MFHNITSQSYLVFTFVFIFWSHTPFNSFHYLSSSFAGKEIELAGDYLTGDQMTTTISKVRGGEAWYVTMCHIPYTNSQWIKYANISREPLNNAYVLSTHWSILSFSTYLSNTHTLTHILSTNSLHQQTGVILPHLCGCWTLLVCMNWLSWDTTSTVQVMT